jgi:hypothetical protein
MLLLLLMMIEEGGVGDREIVMGETEFFTGGFGP